MKLGLDIGYSQTKISFNGKLFKLPTAISYAIDSGINYGSDEVYNYNGKVYRVGEIAVDESFTTTEYRFLKEFGPLILFHVLNKLNLIQNGKLTTDIELRTGLSLADWEFVEEFKQTLSNFKVNDIEIKINKIFIIPQGAGVHYDWCHTNNYVPSSDAIIDIGYNTINYLVFDNGTPLKPKCRSFPGHGVLGIVRPFTNWLESTYKMNFTEQEALKILMKEKFIYQGEEQQDVVKMINELKSNFITKLFNSILVSEKKTLSTSEKVIIAGGGAYFLENIALPKNATFPEKPYEFSNVRGYML
jgi:plasmid segregation protein ParM